MDVSALEVKINSLESQLAELKESSSRSHEVIYDRLRELETKEAVNSERYKSIQDDLASLKAQNKLLLDRIEELSKKPAKRWDNAVTGFISALAGIIAGIVGKSIFGGG